MAAIDVVSGVLSGALKALCIANPNAARLDVRQDPNNADNHLFGPRGKMLGVSWPIFEKILIGLAAIGVLILLWALLKPLVARLRDGKVVAEPEWTPDRADALALLEDADRLAADGRFDEATHLLLRRSVGQITAARPDLLNPASTAREIAGIAVLPAAARAAFGAIASRVERSRYALRCMQLCTRSQPAAQTPLGSLVAHLERCANAGSGAA